jgi:hypothetical protein
MKGEADRIQSMTSKGKSMRTIDEGRPAMLRLSSSDPATGR